MSFSEESRNKAKNTMIDKIMNYYRNDPEMVAIREDEGINLSGIQSELQTCDWRTLALQVSTLPSNYRY